MRPEASELKVVPFPPAKVIGRAVRVIPKENPVPAPRKALAGT